MQFIQKGWKKVSEKLAGTEEYFLKSPSNMLQKEAIVEAVKTYLADGVMLDIGAGRSIYRSFIPSGVTYHAMDYEKTESTYSKDRDLDIIGDVQRMPMSDNTYDFVLCTEVLEHVPHPHDAAREIIRVLKPGGVAIITVPFLGYYHDEPYDFFRYTKHGLRTLFEDAHGRIVEERGLGGLFSFLGYIRSTLLLSVCVNIPVVWNVAFFVNLICSKIDIWFDGLLKTGKIMPLTNVLVVQKPKNTPQS